jgi:hypothetical protein
LGTEDPSVNSVANIIATGSYSNGSITLANRDTSGTAGLTIDVPLTVSFTVDSNGTMTGTLQNPTGAGVTDGKRLFFFGVSQAGAFIRSLVQ